MEDVLSRPRVFRALAELRKAEPAPLTAGGFESAVGYESVAAQRLRADLLEWGLITAEETFRGRLPVILHRLTPAGQAISDLAIRVEQLARQARPNLVKDDAP